MFDKMNADLEENIKEKTGEKLMPGTVEKRIQITKTDQHGM